jgi:hypothetical protein
MACRCLETYLSETVPGVISFLRTTGMSVQICFGIRLPASPGRQLDHGDLEGHAWLRYKEDLFLENDPDMTRTYKETYRHPVHFQNTPCEGSFAMLAS